MNSGRVTAAFGDHRQLLRQTDRTQPKAGTNQIVATASSINYAT